MFTRYKRFTAVVAACAVLGTSAFASRIELVQMGTHMTKIFDGSAAEIVSYDKMSQKAFVVNGNDEAVDILDVSDIKNPMRVGQIKVAHLSEEGKWGMGIQAVDVKHGVVALAISRVYPKGPHFGKNRHYKGLVGFFTTGGEFINSVEVGYLPDNLKFSNDGKLLVVANEGEPSATFFNHNPAGTISVIDTTSIKHANVTNLGFSGFTKKEMMEKGVKVNPSSKVTVAQDLEPEYVAITDDSMYAFVALQEANAMAIVDLMKKEIFDVAGLGFKNHKKKENALDASNKDKKFNLNNWPVMGMYQPDSIDTYMVGGKHYIVSANEGDAKDYDGYSEETRVKKLKLDPKAFPKAKSLQEDKHLGRLKVTTEMGDVDGDGDFDTLYSYGGRSFSIWDMRGKLVYDSGSFFESWTAAMHPKMFNSSNDENKFDDRSDDKGPEPEALDLGKVGNDWFAFIGLERMGGIMVFNITNPKQPQFVQYVNNRNYETTDLKAAVENGTSGDLAPEGIRFVSAENSPTGKPIIIVASEVSGSTTIYEIKQK